MPKVARWPVGDECVECLDLLEYHLVSWAHVLVLVLVVHHIGEAASMLSQVVGG